MRKHVYPSLEGQSPIGPEWLDLPRIATVELTSEDPDYPIENALLPAASAGWRAAGPGQQIIRLVFDSPQRVRRVHLHFVETAATRTQEIALAWAGDPDSRSLREIRRQQWNFSASGATEEVEDWDVDLPSVMTLELRVTPDIAATSPQGGAAVASIKALRLASA